MKVVALLFLVTLVSAEPISFYHFDSASGNVAIDSINGNNAIIFGHDNNGWNANGKVNGCFNFGTGDVRGWFTNKLRNQYDFTITFWMQATAAGKQNITSGQWYNGDGLVDADQANFHNDFGTSLLGKNIAFGVGPTDTTIVSKKQVTDGAWHHVAATRQVVDDTNTIILYIDGVEEARNVTTGGINTQTRDGEWISVGSLNGNVNFYTGQLDELRIYNEALYPEEVQAIYTSERDYIKPGDAPEVNEITQSVTVKDEDNTAIAIFMGVLSFILIVVIIALLVWDARNKKAGAYVTQTDRQ